MASENKKRKARNSYIYNGGAKSKGDKLKRLYYYTKQDRVRNRPRGNSEYEED